MRLYKNAIILLVVLAILAGVYYYINNREAEISDEPNETITIFETEKDKISEINIVTKDSSIHFYKDGEEWKERNSNNIKFVQSRIDSLAYDVATINAEQIVEEDAKDLDIYGLSDPTCTLNIKLVDGTEKTFYLGDKTPTKTEYYFKEKDQATVYTIYSYKGDSIAKGLNEYRDKEIFSLAQEEITSIVLEGKNREKLVIKAEVTEEKASEEAAGETTEEEKEETVKSITDWNMIEPYQRKISVERLHENILSKLTGITIKDFIEDHPQDLAKYGLASPNYVLELEDWNKQKARFLIGNTENGSTYIQVDGNQAVYTVAEDVFAFKDIEPFALVDIFAYIVNIDTVDKIEIVAEGKTTTLEIIHKGEEEEDEYRVDGQEASEDKFKKAYQQVIGLLIDGDHKQQVTGTPDVTCTFYHNDGTETVKMEYISIDDRRYAVVKNGESEFYILKKKVRSMLEHLEDFKKNPMKD